MSTSDTGRTGEKLAAWHLQHKGFRIVEQNYRSTLGEIDIVAVENDELIIVEVKTLKNADTMSPSDNITPEKIRRLRRLAVEYQSSHREFENNDLRIDFVGVVLGPPAKIEHIPDIG